MAEKLTGGFALETLGDMIDHGFSLTIYCEGRDCHHMKRVDIPALATRIGRDHGCNHASLSRLRWKCEQCGGRKVSFRMASTKSEDYMRATGRI